MKNWFDSFNSLFLQQVAEIKQCCLWPVHLPSAIQTCKKSFTQYYCRIFMPLRPRPARGIERSGCQYVHTSVDKVEIFIQGSISRPINGSKLIFHMRMYLYETSRTIQEPWPHDLYFTVHWLQIIKLKIFIQGRILSSTNGGNLIFHMRKYLYETSRNIQEPWPHDLYFTIC